MTQLETDLEQWARKRIFDAGGYMLKWTSPGTRGVPDDIVFWRGGLVDFVEFKKDEDAKPDPLQKLMHQALQNYGHKVWVLDTRLTVTKFIARRAPAY